MQRPPDDSTEEISLQDGWTVNPEYAISEALRRAFRHGKWSRQEFSLWTFAEVEAEVRMGWLLNGEMTEWREVRDSVRAGFESERG